MRLLTNMSAMRGTLLIAIAALLACAQVAVAQELKPAEAPNAEFGQVNGKAVQQASNAVEPAERAGAVVEPTEATASPPRWEAVR